MQSNLTNLAVTHRTAQVFKAQKSTQFLKLLGLLISAVNNLILNLLNVPHIHQNQVFPVFLGVVESFIHRLLTVGKTMWITTDKVWIHWAIVPVDKVGEVL